MATKTVKQSAANAAKDSLVWELVRQLNVVRNCLLRTPTLIIKGGSASAIVASSTTFEAVIAGVIVRKTAADMAALVGTVLADYFGIWVFTMTAAGTLATTTLTSAATLAELVLPTISPSVAVVGAVLVNPTGTGNFVGGTTQLDDGTVVPNAVFYNGQDLAALGDVLSFRETGQPS